MLHASPSHEGAVPSGEFGPHCAVDPWGHDPLHTPTPTPPPIQTINRAAASYKEEPVQVSSRLQDGVIGTTQLLFKARTRRDGSRGGLHRTHLDTCTSQQSVRESEPHHACPVTLVDFEVTKPQGTYSVIQVTGRLLDQLCSDFISEGLVNPRRPSYATQELDASDTAATLCVHCLTCFVVSLPRKPIRTASADGCPFRYVALGDFHYMNCDCNRLSETIVGARNIRIAGSGLRVREQTPHTSVRSAPKL
jgi:hypothetical protein